MTTLTANISALPCSLQMMIQNLAMEPVLESATQRRHAAKMAPVLADIHFIKVEMDLYNKESLCEWWRSGCVRQNYEQYETIDGALIWTLGEFIYYLLKEEIWAIG